MTSRYYPLRMAAIMIETTQDAGRLMHALNDVDRLLRNETNRARHVTLTGIRSDLVATLAHLGSPVDVHAAA